ncbi:hypothetical protein QYE76_069299 [Lolium multiflorum]|uniref:Integrase zinc-binding domain-containing protein n=1 Tax=Lolium multiflorum TaxID=4521 RepID=A0AAD8SGI1_LOLMU|nr:hypothetical protein QYE76_069299 [Lolium multiflorum]
MIAEEQPSLHQEFEQFRMELVSEGFLASIELQPTLISQIKEAQKSNASIDGIKSQLAAGKAPGFTVDEEGVLWYNGRLCVPSDSELKQVILKEAHDTLYSIHPGGTKMYQDLKEQFWWHGMKREIGSYIAKCDICQRVKAEHQRPAGLLQPLQIPEWKWDSVGMDFITGLPKSSKGNDSIWIGAAGELSSPSTIDATPSDATATRRLSTLDNVASSPVEPRGNSGKRSDPLLTPRPRRNLAEDDERREPLIADLI